MSRSGLIVQRSVAKPAGARGAAHVVPQPQLAPHGRRPRRQRARPARGRPCLSARRRPPRLCVARILLRVPLGALRRLATGELRLGGVGGQRHVRGGGGAAAAAVLGRAGAQSDGGGKARAAQLAARLPGARGAHDCGQARCAKLLQRSRAAARAVQAYLKCVAVKTLRPKREFKTMTQLLHELCKPQASRPADRDPIFLFLGGGMAAGALPRRPSPHCFSSARPRLRPCHAQCILRALC